MKMQIRTRQKQFNMEPAIRGSKPLYISGYEQDMLYVMLSYLLPKTDALWDIQPEQKLVVPESTYEQGIDVLIPCYKHANHIESVVSSVLAQHFLKTSIHVLLMDEASIALKDVLEALDARVHCYSHEPLKPGSARNWLIEKGAYSHVLFLDADDPLETPDLLDQFLRFKDYDIVMPFWERNGEAITEANFYNVLYCSQTTALLQRSLLSNVRFDEALVNGGEDTEFFLKAYLQGAKIKYSDTPFHRSLIRKASAWSFIRYGSYDVLYKYRRYFLPLLEKAYTLELDADTLSRLYYTIKLLKNESLSSYSNMNDVAAAGNVGSLCLIRSLPQLHVHRKDNAFYRLVQNIDAMKKANRRVNLMLSSKRRDKSYCVVKKADSVSIIIPCYKQSHLVKAAIDSVLQQTRADIVKEILVLLMDVHSYEQKEALENIDPRITCFCEARLWLPEARNYLIANSSGSHILPLDADDQLVEDAIESMLQYTDVFDIVTADIIKPDGWRSNLDYKGTDNLFELPVASPTALISRCFIDNKLGGQAYDPLFNTGFEDHDFWFRAVLHGRVKYIRKPLIRYRLIVTRGCGEVSYLNMAQANFNRFELYTKYSNIFNEYVDMSCSRGVPLAADIRELMNSIHISLGDLIESQS